MEQQLDAEQALAVLLNGNRRYVAGEAQHPHQSATRRGEVLAGQHPLAAVLTCSDSRVPAEILFDQGIGDIFVIRTAGHVVDDAALGSIEYAAEHLHVPVVVVLGHQRCGAVAATVSGGEAPGHIASIVRLIRPAMVRALGQPGDMVDNVVRAHILEVVSQLRSAPPILSHLVHEGHMQVVGAYYSLQTGEVSLL